MKMSPQLGVAPAFRHLLLRLVLCVACASALFPLAAAAGNFAVSPIRLDLDRNARSGSVTITNDAEAALNAQIQLYEWRQDADGKDVYLLSDDLLYFPRLVTLGAHEQRVVRIGLRGPGAVTEEKSYRLFLEELPQKAQAGGSRLTIAVRFGVPLFVKPVNEEPHGVIERIAMKDRELRMLVRNTGNVHFRIESVTVTSGDRFASEVSGWYLLPGAAREYVVEVPADVCAGLKRIDIGVKTDHLRLEGALDSSPSMCGSRRFTSK